MSNQCRVPAGTVKSRSFRAHRRLADDGMTMVVVTHELGFAREVADAVTFMHEGEIVEVAGPSKFFSAPASEPARAYMAGSL